MSQSETLDSDERELVRFDASQKKLDSFALSNLKKQRAELNRTEVSGVTATVKFNTDTTFSHDWTFESDSKESFRESWDKMMQVAKERLTNGWEERSGLNQSEQEKLWDEILPKMEIDIPDEIVEFLRDKEEANELTEAISITESVYNQVSDSRAKSIGQKLSQYSENLGEYKDKIKLVKKNIKFEEQMELDSRGKGKFSQGRQQTTGDVTWIDEQGREVRTLVYPNKVFHQIGGSSGQNVEFRSKDKALEYYRDNRVA